jgi:hypothetical protein
MQLNHVKPWTGCIVLNLILNFAYAAMMRPH